MIKKDIDVDIDSRAVERLKRWIIVNENQNIKSKLKSDPDMVKAIKKRIEEEANAIKVNKTN